MSDGDASTGKFTVNHHITPQSGRVRSSYVTACAYSRKCCLLPLTPTIATASCLLLINRTEKRNSHCAVRCSLGRKLRYASS